MMSIFYIAYLVCVSSYSIPKSALQPMSESIKPINQSLIFAKRSSTTSAPSNGEEYCEHDQLTSTQCQVSTCCHWNDWEEGDASNYGAGRCWSSIGTNICLDYPTQTQAMNTQHSKNKGRHIIHKKEAMNRHKVS